MWIGHRKEIPKLTFQTVVIKCFTATERASSLTFLELLTHSLSNAETAFSKSLCSAGMPSLPPSSLSTARFNAVTSDKLLSKWILSSPLVMTWNLTFLIPYLFITNLMVACISWKDSSATSEVAFITNAIPRSDKKINRIYKVVTYFRQLYIFFSGRSYPFVVLYSNNSVTNKKIIFWAHLLRALVKNWPVWCAWNPLTWTRKH